jgi:serine/threonine protein kinase
LRVRPLTSGAVLSARYRLESPLGSGATATVWRARDVELGRAVAVKVLGDEGVEPELAARFMREGRILGRLSHPNIVPVLASGEDEGRPYLVMALVEGRTLKECIAEGPLPVEAALDTVTAVAAGLGEAHRVGVVHRDVKPGNIVCGEDGQPHLVDWGIARAGDLTTMTRADVVMGTAAYLAPEQALGESPGPASDVYALGCVLYELLTGAQPFPAESAVAMAYRHVHDPIPMPSATRTEVPRALDAIVARCLSKQPADRYADAGALEAALRRWRSGESDDATGVHTVVQAPLTDATVVMPVSTVALSSPATTGTMGTPRVGPVGRRALVVAGAIAAGIAAIALVGMTTSPGDGDGGTTTSTTAPVAAVVTEPTTTTTAAPPLVAVEVGGKGKGRGKGGKD